ncbi:cyclic pyranopterin phosphate synthase [Moraxella caviae]|uniref:GTP 3',8-cyclase n=1 Tax=Moraxella caviae TaxID=34060 RepID=A0A1T0A6Y8_9GAMM|nr:GTP 3',8-cyclase MoaA [Moraxella caviae]OOR91091.1 cyclic pyranopterin phosphate synthase [Moraxella caviae]STZ14212.1 Molybdenum cofactor biosynthesis protein A [Moraxella caviae]VEW13148.1 Molybdenum cofactor biosynthesis protein A [Moraxella caviae]VEW13456.1 Molybdenum cofactor biosynthesis protein A [Moraxella caviae]
MNSLSVPRIHAKTPFESGASSSSPVLMDGFHRRLTYLRLSVTDFCNFRCEYCLPNGYQGKRPDNELTLSEIDTLLSAFAALGTQKVRLTGGEPSVRRDLADIIALAKQKSGVRTVAVSSNGYKLGKHLSAWHSAGLNQLNLSVDSFNRQVFHKMTGFDMLPTLLKDVDTLLETTDIRVKMNGILMADTAYDNLLAALEFVKQRPITYRFIEFMQTSDNSDLFYAQNQTGRLIKTYLSEHGWQAKVRQSDGGPAIEYQHPDYVGSIGIIEPYAKDFCESCNRLRVSSLGKVHLCLFDSENYDIRPALMAGDVAQTISQIKALMPKKPEHHYLDAHSGLMNNLSLVGG